MLQGFIQKTKYKSYLGIFPKNTRTKIYKLFTNLVFYALYTHLHLIVEFPQGYISHDSY